MSVSIQELTTDTGEVPVLSEAQFAELCADPGFWDQAEEIFDHEKYVAALRARQTNYAQYEEQIDSRNAIIELLMQHPAESIKGFIEHAARVDYRGRTATSANLEQDGDMIGARDTTEVFGTRSRVTNRLDDLYEIRRTIEDGRDERIYRYTANRADHLVVNHNFTIVVSDNGQYGVFSESFPMDENGAVRQRVDRVEGREEEQLLKQFFRSSLEAAQERDKQVDPDGADKDALERLNTLNRMTEPYLYHVA